MQPSIAEFGRLLLATAPQGQGQQFTADSFSQLVTFVLNVGVFVSMAMAGYGVINFIGANDQGAAESQKYIKWIAMGGAGAIICFWLSNFGFPTL